ncbi:TetR/AcrR family transcriptional regulator [Nonomuraea endophytica]|uniref:AcrR family transcriptional regulator n=1 Tax=Nonomuraea endophytica TaxID=714136 RepID=A0A7W8ACZ2_9ACTN|nr:TetR/AcrR family transcriptional regulator [Nonomuraea endophytica]MBB5082473.1 AcrR family transcriptional regulator [Nonomuraea endophytica]
MANPERSTELLWGAKGRGGLNLERIVRAGIELADAEGLAAVSMRRVAERLGYTTMSLYRHVPGKAELVDLMRDTALGTEPDLGPPRGWRADTEAWARSGLEFYRRHPWLLESAGVRHVPGPNSIAGFEQALAIVAATGLRPAQVVAVVGLVGHFVESAAREVVETTRIERRTGVGHDEWWGARDSLYQHLDRYPTLTRIYEEGGFDEPLDPFEFGLQRVLDGIEALIRDEVRDETRCAVCGKVIDPAETGRPRAYCSRACQQKAYRRRKV